MEFSVEIIACLVLTKKLAVGPPMWRRVVAMAAETQSPLASWALLRREQR